MCGEGGGGVYACMRFVCDACTCICFILHVHVQWVTGLTSRPKGRLRPRELWFMIYSCTCT